LYDDLFIFSKNIKYSFIYLKKTSMEKYSTKEVAQTVKEDGIGYSVENY